MPDTRVPNEIADWMMERSWGEHHDQWHWERRWDFWNAVLQRPNLPPGWREWIETKFADAASKGWHRAAFQEGEQGNGEDFLFMHRAMIELLVHEFPQHLHLFRGWEVPPDNYQDSLDPVPVPNPEPKEECAPLRKEICAAKVAGIKAIQTEHNLFSDDDSYGLFVQTQNRPTAADPLARSDDDRTGVHNYLHGRWSGISTDLDLGDPRVNILNTRFWRLHGWIDHQWWRFRQHQNADDTAPEYQSKLRFYKEMMDRKPDHHGVHSFPEVLLSLRKKPSMNAFVDLVQL